MTGIGFEVPTSDDDHLWVNWRGYYDLIEQLALLVQRSDFEFDQILCLARGGLRIGDVLSRVFDKPLAIMSTSSYRSGAGTEQGSLDIAEQITMSHGRLGGRLLVVDDLVDSGVTLGEVCELLRQRYPEVIDLRTGVLWQKAQSKVTPDFVVRHLQGNPWIHQPFEGYDGLSVAQLIERRQAK